MNLRCIATLREAFGVAVGLSDHTVGSMAAVLGAGLGMAILEKHFTLDRTLPGPDHAASADPEEFTQLVRSVRKAEVMLGNGIKEAAGCEASTREAVRRACAGPPTCLPGTLSGRGIWRDCEAVAQGFRPRRRAASGGGPCGGLLSLEFRLRKKNLKDS